MHVKTTERLARFEQFVRDDTQIRLEQAQFAWTEHVRGLTVLDIVPDGVETNLKDLESDYPELILESRELLAKYRGARDDVVDRIARSSDLPHFDLKNEHLHTELKTAAADQVSAMESLSDPEKIRQRLANVMKKRKELELLHEVKNQREVIVAEITRLKNRESLERGKNEAATGPMTKKVLELSEANITEVVRDTFTRETDRLHLERVTIARTRGDRGILLHQPKLVGTRQNVALPRVFSEGEKTALGLAAFFTEAQLDASKSALILDDPVSSLDHIRRGCVAARLASLAESRQVVVFTHDVAFVADLKREAQGRGASVTERSVVRGFGADKRPGTCSSKHPWKAKDVSERLGELRSELARLKRDQGSWDEQTYERAVASWAGDLSETWERIFSQEIVGQLLGEGGLEVRPAMAKILVRFTETDNAEFQASYSRVSQWVKRHDKSALVNYVAPDVATLEHELKLIELWFSRIKQYKT